MFIWNIMITNIIKLSFAHKLSVIHLHRLVDIVWKFCQVHICTRFKGAPEMFTEIGQKYLLLTQHWAAVTSEDWQRSIELRRRQEEGCYQIKQTWRFFSEIREYGDVGCLSPAEWSLSGAHAGCCFWRKQGHVAFCSHWKFQEMSSLRRGTNYCQQIIRGLWKTTLTGEILYYSDGALLSLCAEEVLPLVQVRPSSRSKPSGHSQLKEPRVFTHLDPTGQGSLSHSSRSGHFYTDMLHLESTWIHKRKC